MLIYLTLLETLCLICVVGFVLHLPKAWGEDPKPKPAKAVLMEQRHEELMRYTFQPGTVFLASLETFVSSDHNQMNDLVEVRLFKDVWVGNRKILKRMTRMIGHIAAMTQPLEGRNGSVVLKIHELELWNGDRVPVAGSILPTMKGDTFGGETTDPTRYQIIRYDVWGIGKYNRAVKSGPRAMGQLVELKPGDMVRVVLDSPLDLVLPPENPLGY